MGARGRAGLLRGLSRLSESLGTIEERKRRRLADALAQEEAARADEYLALAQEDRKRLSDRLVSERSAAMAAKNEERKLAAALELDAVKKSIANRRVNKALYEGQGPKALRIARNRGISLEGVPVDMLKPAKVETPAAPKEPGTMLERLFGPDELRAMIRADKVKEAAAEPAPKASARGLVAGLEPGLRGRFDEAVSGLTEPSTGDSLGVLGSLTKAEKAPRQTKFESAENEIYAAAQTTQALGSGEFGIELTEDGVKVAADLMSADANVRERAAKHLRSANKIRKLVRIAED